MTKVKVNLDDPEIRKEYFPEDFIDDERYNKFIRKNDLGNKDYGQILNSIKVPNVNLDPNNLDKEEFNKFFEERYQRPKTKFVGGLNDKFSSNLTPIASYNSFMIDKKFDSEYLGMSNYRKSQRIEEEEQDFELGRDLLNQYNGISSMEEFNNINAEINEKLSSHLKEKNEKKNKNYIEKYKHIYKKV